MSVPYYPNLCVTQRETRFGAIETSHPTLYKNPIPGKKIYEVDMLECLKEIWGDNILLARSLTYKLVSGSCSDDEYRALLSSYYRKYAAFTNYVNSALLFGDRSVPKITKLVVPARTLINSYTDKALIQIKDSGAKFLMRTHDYVYCSFPEQSCAVLSIGGVRAVC